MKKSRRSSAGLVIEHLEGISRTAIKRYPDIITEFLRGRSCVYALYKGNDLYYVGWLKTFVQDFVDTFVTGMPRPRIVR